MFGFLKKIFGFGTVSGGSFASTDTLTDQVIAYLLSLIRRQDLLSDTLERYRQARALPADERELASVGIFYSLEKFIVKNAPPTTAKLVTKDELRSEVLAKFPLASMRLPLRLVFLPEFERNLALYEVGVLHLTDYFVATLGFAEFQRLVGNAVKGTALQDAVFTGRRIYFGTIAAPKDKDAFEALKAAFKKLYSAIYERLLADLGREASDGFAAKIYNAVRAAYEPEAIASFLEVLPENLLIGERKVFIGREEMRSKISSALSEEREKLQKYELLSKELAEKNRALDESKKAMLNLLEDVSEEKAKVEETVKKRTIQLREEQARMLAAVNSFVFGFILFDLESNPIIISPVATKILSMGKEEVTLAALIKRIGSSFDLKKAYDECFLEKKPVEGDDFSLDNKFIRVFLTPVLLGNEDKAIGVAMLIRDVTDIKLLDRAKDEFFAVASHELRTPLTAIRGNMAMIRDFFGGEIKSKDLLEMVEDTHSASVRLIKIVNDFLDVSRLEQQKAVFKPEVFDFKKVVYDMVKQFEIAAANKKISLIMEGLDKEYPQVAADRDRATQVVSNLIDNAIKYTQQGGVIVRLKPEEKMLCAYVIDTGPGISGPNQGLLFKKFQQAGEKMLARDVTQSTGLGLYISKLVVEGMGGRVELVKSEVGKGSAFRICLPIADKK